MRHETAAQVDPAAERPDAGRWRYVRETVAELYGTVGDAWVS